MARNPQVRTSPASSPPRAEEDRDQVREEDRDQVRDEDRSGLVDVEQHNRAASDAGRARAEKMIRHCAGPFSDLMKEMLTGAVSADDGARRAERIAEKLRALAVIVVKCDKS